MLAQSLTRSRSGGHQNNPVKIIMNNRERIDAYFQACSVGTANDIADHFTADAIVYNTNHKPVQGAATIGAFWNEIRDRWQQAHWYVDTCISEGDVAAIEWTMTGISGEGEFTVRGSEHYRFEAGLIAEIRQYWTFNRTALNTALVEFPYSARAIYHAAK